MAFTIHYVMRRLGTDRETAAAVRRTMQLGRSELERTEAGAKRLAECYNRPTTRDLRMSELDRILRTHGVEAIDLRCGSTLWYLNTGDTYTPTILFEVGRYRIGDWGSIVERRG